MKGRSILKIVIGISIVLFLLFTADLEKIILSIQRAEPILFSIALLTVPVMLLLRFIKWKVFISSSNLNVPFKDASKIYIIGFFFNLLTPSNIGELSRVYYLKRYYDTPTSISLSILVLDKLSDFIIVFIVGILGIFVLSTAASVLSPLTISLLIFLVVVFGYILFNENTFLRIANWIFQKFTFLVKYFYKGKKIDPKKVALSIYSPFKAIKSRFTTLSLLATLSIAVWVVYALQLFFLIASFGHQIDIINVFMIASIGTLAGLIPITVGGIGTRDAALVYLFSLFGVLYEKAILISLLFFVISQLIPAIVGGIVYIAFKKRQRIDSDFKSAFIET